MEYPGTGNGYVYTIPQTLDPGTKSSSRSMGDKSLREPEGGSAGRAAGTGSRAGPRSDVRAARRVSCEL
eukprot:1543036-Rhodomonas_salina.1